MESQSGGRVCLVGARGGRWVGSELVPVWGYRCASPVPSEPWYHEPVVKAVPHVGSNNWSSSVGTWLLAECTRRRRYRSM